MSGTRGGLARILAMGVALALALLLLGAREATAGHYTVVQCGWYFDADADWADTTGGAKFRSDRWCVPPSGADAFDGVHMKSFTKGGATLSGTRFARWRWVAPGGTGITGVSGRWWQVLHDGMEQRLGTGTWSGGFDPFAIATGTDVNPRLFSASFAVPQPALEDRLLCARPEGKWCSLEQDSWSAVRALAITLFDGYGPVPGHAGAELAAGGWRRGAQRVNYWDTDVGGGVRYSETRIDGARVGLTEYQCAKAFIDGEWKATRMQPCPTGAAGEVTVQTTNFSDGPHELTRCATDFSGNSACLFPVGLLIDNHPPTSPRNLTLASGEGWRRVDDFDFSWSNPDQGPASPIGGAYWRITGPAGYDTGLKLTTGRGISSLADRAVPRPGVFTFRIWLRDEAGNADSSSAIEMPMRLDDVPPGIAFEPLPDPVGTELPGAVSAEVSDGHSGAASGQIAYKRVNAEHWIELPSKLEEGDEPGSGRLVAPVPGSLEPGTYVFRAVAEDLAGNTASTTRRADGTEMALRKTPPPVGPSRPAARQGDGARAAPRAKTRLFAELRWRRRRGQSVTVPFGAGAALSGRLLSTTGGGLSKRRLRVISRPSQGALARRQVEFIHTGPHGGFKLALRVGPSRRITISFAGERGLEPARRAALSLRVRGSATFKAAPRSLRNGRTVRLWGRVRTRGAPIPRRGKLIAIQYYESESRLWRPVLVTRSDHSGRFRARYRFRYITGSAQIRLRAVALAEERWPYAPGASRPVLVRVSG
jgi:hypothetical protein